MALRNYGWVLMVLVVAGVPVFCQTAPTAAANEQKVSLGEAAIAHDAAGRVALSGRLRSTDLRGSQDSPVTNTRIVISNNGSNLYTYVSGWATFYDQEGVRCGEGLFKINALAPGEPAETDTPGLRLVCAPASWRIVAINLLTPTVDVAKPGQAGSVSAMTVSSNSSTSSPGPLLLSIDGEDHPIQLGNPIRIRNGSKSMTLVLKRGQ
jgi:hypothetical protein